MTLEQQRYRSANALRRTLARQLREAREATNPLMSQPVAGDLVGRDGAAISRLEKGLTQKYRPEVVATLLRGYGVSEGEIETAVIAARQLSQALARARATPGWWEEFGRETPTELRTYLEYENDVHALHMWQPSVVPGLLQTADYARAIMAAALDPAEDIERNVALRMARQDILDRPENVPELFVVLDESVLYRQIGSAQIMAAQLAKLCETSRMPNVTIRMLPFTRGAHIGLIGGSIVVFDFGDDADPVIYLENHAGANYRDGAGTTAPFVRVVTSLWEMALSAEESRHRLATAHAAA